MNMGTLIGMGVWTVAVCYLLGGCAITPVRTTWSKPGASPGEFERVSTECEDDRGMAGLKGSAGYEVCMQQHGWLLIEEPAD